MDRGRALCAARYQAPRVHRRYGVADRLRARADAAAASIPPPSVLQTWRKGHMSPQSQANTAPSELDAPLDYARRGIPVFPTNPLDKKPLTPNGFKDAIIDENQIRTWWTRWPNAMVAAPTGSASGMWVIDLDVDPVKKVDGMATLAQLITQR